MKQEYQKPTAQWLSFQLNSPLTVSGTPGFEPDNVGGYTSIDDKSSYQNGD